MPESHAQKPLNKSVSEIQSQLIEFSNALDLTECNASFMQVLAEFLQPLGKPLEQLTIAELAQIIEHCRSAFNAGIKPRVEHVNISPTKAKSLKKQHEIIGYSLSSLCIEQNEINRACLKVDVLELDRMLDDLPNPPPKTSRFNVLNSAKKLIVKRIPFDQAKQYEDCIVKLADMEYSL